MANTYDEKGLFVKASLIDEKLQKFADMVQQCTSCGWKGVPFSSDKMEAEQCPECGEYSLEPTGETDSDETVSIGEGIEEELGYTDPEDWMSYDEPAAAVI